MVKVLNSSPKDGPHHGCWWLRTFCGSILASTALVLPCHCPSIMEDLGFIAFYPILLVLNSSSMAVLALVGGKLIDILGVKRMTVLAVSGVPPAALGAAAPESACVCGVLHGHGLLSRHRITMPVAKDLRYQFPGRTPLLYGASILPRTMWGCWWGLCWVV